MTKQPTWKLDNDGHYSIIGNPYIGPLPSGAYNLMMTSNGVTQTWYFMPSKSNSDTLIDLPGLPIKYILDQIQTFWDRSAEYKKYGFLQKRGIMLYGPPGCGKSSIVGLLLQQLYKQNGVCFLGTEGFALMTGGIREFRKSEPDRPIMTLVEDIETGFESSNGNNNAQSEKAALALYDGEHQFDNVVHVATTNKPELIADRFIRRPGRFDLVIGVHAPSRETREAYLKIICNGHLTPKQLSEILDKTEGLSLAYLREIASTYLVLGLPLDETIARLQAQSKQKFKTTKTGFTIGFTEKEDV